MFECEKKYQELISYVFIATCNTVKEFPYKDWAKSVSFDAKLNRLPFEAFVKQKLQLYRRFLNPDTKIIRTYSLYEVSV